MQPLSKEKPMNLDLYKILPEEISDEAAAHVDTQINKVSPAERFDVNAAIINAIKT